jgi:hypothetical protein
MSQIINALRDTIGHIRAESSGRASTLELEAARIRLQANKRIEDLEAIIEAVEAEIKK